MPSEPLAVTALAADKRLTVAWSPPEIHNTPIAGYIIKVYQPTDGDPLVTATVLGVSLRTKQFCTQLTKAYEAETSCISCY